MDSLIDSIVEILERFGSLLIFCTLLVLATASLSYIFYIKTEKVRTNRAFLLFLLFFFSLIISALATGISSIVFSDPSSVAPQANSIQFELQSCERDSKLPNVICSISIKSLTKDDQDLSLIQTWNQGYTSDQLSPKSSNSRIIGIDGTEYLVDGIQFGPSNEGYSTLIQNVPVRANFRFLNVSKEINKLSAVEIIYYLRANGSTYYKRGVRFHDVALTTQEKALNQLPTS